MQLTKKFSVGKTINMSQKPVVSCRYPKRDRMKVVEKIPAIIPPTTEIKVLAKRVTRSAVTNPVKKEMPSKRRKISEESEDEEYKDNESSTEDVEEISDEEVISSDEEILVGKKKGKQKIKVVKKPMKSKKKPSETPLCSQKDVLDTNNEMDYAPYCVNPFDKTIRD